MRKISEIKGEDALDVLADVLEQLSIIFGDQEFAKLVRSGASRMEEAKYLLKVHKKEILVIMAVLDEADPATYAPSVVQIPIKMMELLNDPDIHLLFPSLDQVTSSGSATANTEATEQG